MRREEAEIAIVGAGFAGSLMALILHRLGRRVMLLERLRHPRFAIGEASTPFANLLLQDLARRYDLPRLAPLAKYGPWKRAYPGLACGLKRGFSFFQHHAGQPFRPTPNHAEELLVAASPANEDSDTHWFRQEFDHFFVQEAQAAGIPYLDEIALTARRHEPGWRLRGEREGEAFEIECSFVIDAAGPGAFLAQALDIDTRPTAMRTHSWSVYSHFVGVGKWQESLEDLGAATADYPFSCDDSTLHHVLDEGWMWVIPFENGITSAGFLLDGARCSSDARLTPEQEWQTIMRRYPSIAAQFSRATPVQPWLRSGRLQRTATIMAGPDWVLLPHAAYALDALFSVGNAHTLLGIERLGEIFAEHWGRPTLASELRRYESCLRSEIQYTDALVHACYQGFGRFRLFAATSMLYFAGVHAAELARRENRAQPTDRFLSSHYESLAEAVRRVPARILGVTSDIEYGNFEAWVREQVRPLNQGGFCDPAKGNLYPCG